MSALCRAESTTNTQTNTKIHNSLQKYIKQKITSQISVDIHLNLHRGHQVFRVLNLDQSPRPQALTDHPEPRLIARALEPWSITLNLDRSPWTSIDHPELQSITLNLNQLPGPLSLDWSVMQTPEPWLIPGPSKLFRVLCRRSDVWQVEQVWCSSSWFQS